MTMRYLVVSCLGLLLVFLPVQSAPKETEIDRSISRALEFLAKSQDKTDGSWSLNSGKNPASTSLGVMAFLSAGHVPGEGKYGEKLERGIRYVLKQQKANGLIASPGVPEMYQHGISTLMLAEVAGMTSGDLGREVRKKLEKAVKLILDSQRTEGNARGGWRYSAADKESDISVTGWQVMALRAAKNLGCDVPAVNIDMAVKYIKSCRDESTGGFRYQPGAQLTVPCTGTSIVALELCGKEKRRSPELLKAGSFLLKNPPTWHSPFFAYSVYYCSQATFQLGGNYWDFYRSHLHKILLTNQKSNGCWDADGHGPNYCTAMAVLALTVEYRYLPIYQRGDDSEDVIKE
jgi:hypothetical protein